MMRFGKALAPGAMIFCVAATAVGTTGAGADVPDPRLGALLGQEQRGMGAVAPGHVERILGTERAETAQERPPSRPATGEELACLTRALYHEARGEGSAGMRAVAEVVLNRVEAAGFPDSICSVVYQGAENPAGCQFSFVCDGSDARPTEPRAWSRAQGIARDMAEGAPRRLTDGATHFHTLQVRPRWASVYAMTAEIGAHRFYRASLSVASN